MQCFTCSWTSNLPVNCTNVDVALWTDTSVFFILQIRFATRSVMLCLTPISSRILMLKLLVVRKKHIFFLSDATSSCPGVSCERHMNGRISNFLHVNGGRPILWHNSPKFCQMSIDWYAFSDWYGSNVLFPPPPFTETVAKTGMILLAGEVTSRANVDYQKVVRDTIKYIGYDDSSKGIMANLLWLD